MNDLIVGMKTRWPGVIACRFGQLAFVQGRDRIHMCLLATISTQVIAGQKYGYQQGQLRNAKAS